MRMEWFTCRVQFVNDLDPFASSNSSFPEPMRPPLHTFSAGLPLADQLAPVLRLLSAPHQVENRTKWKRTIVGDLVSIGRNRSSLSNLVTDKRSVDENSWEKTEGRPALENLATKKGPNESTTQVPQSIFRNFPPRNVEEIRKNESTKTRSKKGKENVLSRSSPLTLRILRQGKSRTSLNQSASPHLLPSKSDKFLVTNSCFFWGLHCAVKPVNFSFFPSSGSPAFLPQSKNSRLEPTCSLLWIPL